MNLNSQHAKESLFIEKKKTQFIRLEDMDLTDKTINSVLTKKANGQI